MVIIGVHSRALKPVLMGPDRGAGVAELALASGNGAGGKA
jgi:hypothetical protein